MQKLTTLFSIAMLSLMLVVQGCKKDKNDDGGKPSLTLTKATYQPGEFAILQSNKGYGFTESFAGTIDGKSTAVFVLDSNRLAFIVPVKPAGNYVLNLQKDAFENNEISFAIGSYTPVANPTQEIANFGTNATSRVSELEALKNQHGYNISQQNIDEINQLIAAYQTAISSLSNEEKEELAYFVKSNGLLSAPIQPITFMDSFYTAKAAFDPGDEMNIVGKDFVKSMIINISVAGALGGLLSVPDLSITKVVALGAAVTLAINLAHTSSILDRMTNLIGTAGEFDINSVKKFRPNINTSFIDRIRFRNLMDSDFNTQNFLGNIVDKARVFERYWNNLQSGLQKIASWFSGAPNKLSGTAKKLRDNPVFKTFFAKQEYITINNITNNNINVTVVNTGGEMQLKATSNLTQKTNFKFDVTYTHPDLGHKITKTVDAEFDPNSASNPILDQMIQYGPWKYYDDPNDPNGGIYKRTFTYTQVITEQCEDAGCVNFFVETLYGISTTSNDSIFNLTSSGVVIGSLKVISVTSTSLVIDWENNGNFEETFPWQ